MSFREVHQIDDRTRLIVRQEYDVEPEYILGDVLAIQDISHSDSANRSGWFNTEDEHRHAIREILNFHGGYYSRGRDGMLAGIEKSLTRAGLHFAIFDIHAYTQGSERAVVVYSPEMAINNYIQQAIQNWYSGEIYCIQLETRPLACECGCLGDWEYVDSLGYVENIDPYNKDEVLAVFERDCLSLSAVTA